jgi:hypothetical protein
MDPRFFQLVENEIAKLLESVRAGNEPDNQELATAVYGTLRKQHPKL